MVQHHGWSLRELEEMLPFERDVYVDLLTKFMKDLEKEKVNPKVIHYGMPMRQ